MAKRMTLKAALEEVEVLRLECDRLRIELRGAKDLIAQRPLSNFVARATSRRDEFQALSNKHGFANVRILGGQFQVRDGSGNWNSVK